MKKRLCLALLFVSLNSAFIVQAVERISILKSIISPAALVFDVGAHVGNKTMQYLEQGAGKVVCFEPQPECLSRLRTRFVRYPEVIIEPVGLSFKDDTLTMFQATDETTISTVSEEWVKNSRFSGHYTWNKQINIKVTTLDKMIEKYGIPHFCKIDVENYEYEVLKGLSKPIPFISFEFAQEFLENAYKTIEHLKNIGYKKFNIGIAEHDNFWFDDWIDADVFCDVLSEFAQRDWSFIVKLWGDIYAAFD